MLTASARIGYLLKLTYQSWLSHNADRMGAALAFYTLLSLAPLVTFSLAVGSVFLRGTAMESHLIQEVRIFAGREAAHLVEAMSREAHNPSTSVFASFLGLITILIGASGVFAELRAALNTMWDIQPRGAFGFLGLIRERMLSIGLVLAIGFLLVVSLVFSALLAIAGNLFSDFLTVPVTVLELVNFLVSFTGIFVMFALVLRYIPDARLEWRYVLIGAALNAFLFSVGKSLIGVYLGRTAIMSLYGASGSTVAVTVWAYYSAQLFLFGAEFANVYRRLRLSSILKSKLPIGNDVVP